MRPDVEHLTCRELVEVLTDYLDGALEPAERADVERHLVICRGCSNYTEQMRSTLGVLSRLADEPPDPVQPASARDLPRLAGGAGRMIAFKFLRDGRVGPFSGVRWPPPGEWLHAVPGADTCEGRVHACRGQDLPEWMEAELWRVELDGDVHVDCGKLVADRGRLVERIAVWNADFMAAFAQACTLRARDAALLVLAPEGVSAPARAALQRATDAQHIAAVAADADLVGPLDPQGTRAAGYAGDAARHVLGARAQPATAPTHAAVNGFIAAHAAAFAEDDLGAVERERAWQAAWIAHHAGL